MKDTNVVRFPNTKDEQRDPNVVAERLHVMKVTAIEDSIEFLIPPIFDAITTAGFTIEDDRKNMLLIEILRSIMADHFKISTPLNNFILANADEIDMVLGFEPVGALNQKK